MRATIQERTRIRGMWAALAFGIVLATMIAGCVQGAGRVTNETREVGAFSRIDASAGIQVVVRIGPDQAIEVSAHENLHPVITTEVAGDTLRIEPDQDFTTSASVTVTIVVPALDGITLSGGAKAQIDGLDGQALDVQISGGAEMTATGTVDVIALDADGGATAHLEELSAKTITVALTGAARATVLASDAVRGAADGGSRLTVLGDAELSVDVSGGAAAAGE